MSRRAAASPWRRPASFDAFLRRLRPETATLSKEVNVTGPSARLQPCPLRRLTPAACPPPQPPKRISSLLFLDTPALGPVQAAGFIPVLRYEKMIDRSRLLSQSRLLEPCGPKPQPRGGPHLAMPSSAGFDPKRQRVRPENISAASPAQGFSLSPQESGSSRNWALQESAAFASEYTGQAFPELSCTRQQTTSGPVSGAACRISYAQILSAAITPRTRAEYPQRRPNPRRRPRWDPWRASADSSTDRPSRPRSERRGQP